MLLIRMACQGGNSMYALGLQWDVRGKPDGGRYPPTQLRDKLVLGRQRFTPDGPDSSCSRHSLKLE